MQDQAAVRSMSMEEFNRLPAKGGSRAISPQRKAIVAMKPNEVIVLEHTPSGHSKRGCALSQILVFIRTQHPERIFISRHLEDGNVAVACIAKPD